MVFQMKDKCSKCSSCVADENCYTLKSNRTKKSLMKCLISHINTIIYKYIYNNYILYYIKCSKCSSVFDLFSGFIIITYYFFLRNLLHLLHFGKRSIFLYKHWILSVASIDATLCYTCYTSGAV